LPPREGLDERRGFALKLMKYFLGVAVLEPRANSIFGEKIAGADYACPTLSKEKASVRMTCSARKFVHDLNTSFATPLVQKTSGGLHGGGAALTGRVVLAA
jgi:hypothetical protein